MQKAALALFIMLATATPLLAQSRASVGAFATIVNPVSIESILPANRVTPNQSVSDLISAAITSKTPGRFTGENREIASIKLWNNNYSFAVIPVELLVMKNSVSDETFNLEKMTANISAQNQTEINSYIISINAAISLSPTQPAGLYKPTTAFDVIISFE